MPRLLTIIAIALSCCVASQAGEECAVDSSVTLEKQTEKDDDVTLEFRVDLTTEKDCSSVAYDLVLEVKLPNGQWKSLRIPRKAEIDNGSASETVDYKMTDLELLEYHVGIVGCAHS